MVDAKALVAKALKVRDDSLETVAQTFPAIADPGLDPSVLAAQYLTAEEMAITNMNAEDLVPAMQKKELSVVTVLKAFLRRAYLAQVGTNCLTEAMVDEAMARARELENHPDPKSLPLYGLPISVKEMLALKGHVLNSSYVAWIDNEPEKANAKVCDSLWEAGAVFYVRTTQPQFVMHLETDSNVYGVTTCAFNRDLSSGGSSGGEGALIGFRGSVMGVGTDIGGSIRGPCSYNGIYGMRPTTKLISREGMRSGNFFQLGILGTAGPMTTSLKGIDMFMQVMADYGGPKMYDGLVPLLWSPIEQVPLPKKIRVGVMLDDGLVRPHPPITRAIEMVRDKLSKADSDFEIVPFTPMDHSRAWDLTLSAFIVDGGEQVKRYAAAGDEELLELSKFLIDENPFRKKLTIEEYTSLLLDITAYRQQYYEHWKQSAVDVLLCPVTAGASQLHNTSRYWGYTSQWNLLDYPSVVMPVTDVDVALDAKPAYEPRNSYDKYNWDNYDAQKWIGAKACVQIVGRPYDDNRIVAVCKKIQQAME